MQGNIALGIGSFQLQATAHNNITGERILPGKSYTAARGALAINLHLVGCLQLRVDRQVAAAAEAVGFARTQGNIALVGQIIQCANGQFSARQIEIGRRSQSQHTGRVCIDNIQQGCIVQAQSIAIRKRDGCTTQSRNAIIGELISCTLDVDILDIVCRVGQVHRTA